jgi:hypothetical protein
MTAGTADGLDVPQGSIAVSEWRAASRRLRGRRITLRSKLKGRRINEEEFGRAHAESKAMFEAEVAQVRLL